MTRMTLHNKIISKTKSLIYQPWILQYLFSVSSIILLHIMDNHGPKRHPPQKISYFSNALIVHLVDFPIYYIGCISERHFVVAGGGGSSKTGVHNQINILELVPTGESCTAELIMKYPTPEEIPDAIMTGSIMKDLPIISTRMVTGGRNATIYDISFDPHKKTFAITDFDFLVDKLVKVEQKSIKYVPGKILTGGLDGQLTIWDVSQKGKRIEQNLKAHSKEIDEIDVDLVNQQIVTLSRDEGRCAIWSLSNLKLLQEFKKDFINKSPGNGATSAKYCYRACKYAYDSTSVSNKTTRDSFLLVACNPSPAKGPSLLYRWDVRNFKDSKSVPVTMDGIMAMTVSSDGIYVGIGTTAGSVSVFEVKRMKQIYKVEGAHRSIVTSLEFLAPKMESLSLTNSQTCALLSASIDRRVVLHRPKKSSLCSWLLTIVFVVIIYILYMLLNHFIATQASGPSESSNVTET